MKDMKHVAVESIRTPALVARSAGEGIGQDHRRAAWELQAHRRGGDGTDLHDA